MVRWRRCASRRKSELLKNIAQALGFPDWFGHNWDALEDCLSDLSWREAPGYVLLFEKPSARRRLRRADRRAALQRRILGARAASRSSRVFVDPARTLPLPDLFRQS